MKGECRKYGERNTQKQERLYRKGIGSRWCGPCVCHYFQTADRAGQAISSYESGDLGGAGQAAGGGSDDGDDDERKRGPVNAADYE